MAKQSYRDNWPNINWSQEKGIAQKGKSKESSKSRLLSVQETVKAVRTPIHQRNDKTFRYTD